MKFLIIIPPKDFKDESVSLVKLLLDKWSVRYDISSYTSNDCIGTHGAVYRPTIHASKAVSTNYDGLVLIDGNGIEAYKLYDYRPLLDLVMHFNDSNKYIISLGNSVKIPARANIVREKRISVVDDRETIRLVNLFHGVPSKNEYEIAGNLISIKDTGNAMEDPLVKILDSIGAS